MILRQHFALSLSLKYSYVGQSPLDALNNCVDRNEFVDEAIRVR